MKLGTDLNGSFRLHVNDSNVKLYGNNLCLVCAIVLSGNSFNMIDLLFKFLSLANVSHTTFYNYQRHYICPAVDRLYQKEQVCTSCILQCHALIFISGKIIRNE